MRKIEVFFHFGKLLNMTKVGEKLYISQSAVSQTIKDLEFEFGVKLYSKLGKSIFLTKEGEILYKYCQRIYNLYNECKELINNEKKIKIGASTTIGIYVLPDIIRKFGAVYDTKIDFSIKVENTEKIEDYTLSNEIDFGLIEGYIRDNNVIEEVIWEDELIFIEKYSKKNRCINKEELCKEKIIIREKGSGTREVFEEAMKENKLKYNISFELGNTEAIKKVVEAGMGISCISKLAVSDEIRNKRLSQLYVDDLKIKRNFYFIKHKDKNLESYILDFIEFAKRNYKQNL